jgi:hypothetical protein
MKRVTIVDENGNPVVPAVGTKVRVTSPTGERFDATFLRVSGDRAEVRYENGHTAALGTMEAKEIVVVQPSLAKGGPVEVNGVDVRSETLPGIEPPPKKEPTDAERRRLDYAIRRYANLAPAIELFCSRLQAWDVGGSLRPVGLHADALLSFWNDIGEDLKLLKSDGVAVRVTGRSRQNAWMRVRAKVSLIESARKLYTEVYPDEVLDNLTIKAVLENSVFLASGEREIGIVPKASCVKPGQRGGNR